MTPGSKRSNSIERAALTKLLAGHAREIDALDGGGCDRTISHVSATSPRAPAGDGDAALTAVRTNG